MHHDLRNYGDDQGALCTRLLKYKAMAKNHRSDFYGDYQPIQGLELLLDHTAGTCFLPQDDYHGAKEARLGDRK